MLKFYNSLGRKVQEFRPIRDGEVKMYTCGPTVWNYAHIGNFRTFVFEDLLRRYLRFKGFKVFQVMNITDVEDKIIKGIREFHKPLMELTRFYEAAFMADLDSLRVERADLYPRATEHIPEMVKLIKTLIDKKYAYRAPDGSIYFSVSKFRNYGALSGVRLDSLKPAGRVASDHYEEKLEAADFALWKAWDKDDGEVFWETELGKGRPGWSIECSAMSMKYLGESFDIHTGGMDNKFPHHENEIAQSEAATGKKFVNYWLHSEFLNIRGEEMHKSLGNVVYLRDLANQGWDPMDVRLFLITSRYRDPMDLADTSLAQARAQRGRLMDFVLRLKSVGAPERRVSKASEGLVEDFEEAMDDDLNTPKALSVLFAYVKKMNTLMDSGSVGTEEAEGAIGALKRVDSVLGIMEFEEEELPPRLAELVARRDEARKKKDFAESDRLRKVLLDEGIVVEDTPAGSRWKRAPRG
ncbi:MAG: cysteine--tRNA ligase [Nitrososphaerota archaeon]|nr:cysteine--tRNA ligase [Nitrososphaerota archaeon]MDG7023053.1 cysteine--tRNA ligase [Nitrososphaerota archaeon]